jgi:uncharacterized membrane protein
MLAVSGSALLAQADDSSSPLLWAMVLIVIVLVLFGAVAWARKRLSAKEDFHGEGFSLSDLRRMHAEGKLSDEEFDRAKGKMVETLHAAQAQQEAAKAEAAKRGSM